MCTNQCPLSSHSILFIVFLIYLEIFLRSWWCIQQLPFSFFDDWVSANSFCSFSYMFRFDIRNYAYFLLMSCYFFQDKNCYQCVTLCKFYLRIFYVQCLRVGNAYFWSWWCHSDRLGMISFESEDILNIFIS